MTRPLPLKFAAFAAGWLLAIQAGAQVALPLPAEIDATGSGHGIVRGEPAGSNGSARKAAEEKVESDYGIAMKKCESLKNADKPACTARAEAERSKGMTEIGASPRSTPSTPEGQTPSRSPP